MGVNLKIHPLLNSLLLRINLKIHPLPNHIIRIKIYLNTYLRIVDLSLLLLVYSPFPSVPFPHLFTWYQSFIP